MPSRDGAVFLPQQESPFAGGLGVGFLAFRSSIRGDRAGRDGRGTDAVDARTSSEFMEARHTIEHEVGASSGKIDKELKLYKSDYPTIVESRSSAARSSLRVLLGFGFETLG